MAIWCPPPWPQMYKILYSAIGWLPSSLAGRAAILLRVVLPPSHRLCVSSSAQKAWPRSHWNGGRMQDREKGFGHCSPSDGTLFVGLVALLEAISWAFYDAGMCVVCEGVQNIAASRGRRTSTWATQDRGRHCSNLHRAVCRQDSSPARARSLPVQD